MMGNRRTDEKGKAPASANPLIEANNDYANNSSPNTPPPRGLTLLEGNVEEDTFDSLLDMASSFADLEAFHRSVAQGIPETISNPRGYSMNLNSFQNPQINMSYNTVNTNLQGVPLLLDWNVSQNQQCVNQGHNAISSGGVSAFGGESSFISFNRPQINRDITGSSFLFHPRGSAPVHTQNNASFNQSQSRIQGNFEGSFLSLGIGGTEESVSRSQLGSKEISDKLKETASNEFKMAWAQKATGQTLDAGFMGVDSNNSGFSNQFCHKNPITSTNNEIGFHGSLNSALGSSPQHILHMQQNDMQHDKNIRSGDFNRFREGKLKEAASMELKLVHAQKSTSQTSGRSLGSSFMDFQTNTSGFSNQFNNIDRMTSTKNEAGVFNTLNSGLGTSPHHMLQMQQKDSRNIGSVDLGHHRAFIGNQSVCSGIVGGNSAPFFNPQPHNLNKPPEFEKPSWLNSYCTPSEQLQYMRSTTANSPNYAGRVISQNATHNQVPGSNMFSPRMEAPKVSWVNRGPAGVNAPFPKRLGVEFDVRNSFQPSQRHSSPMGTSLQATSTDQACQLSDRGSIRLTDHVLQPSIGRTEVASISYPTNSQEPFFARGKSRNALQLAKTPQGAPSTNASTVIDQSQKPDLRIRPPHKRGAVVPHPASCWVQRQKINHPTIHHSLAKPYIPITAAQIHPSVPVGSQTQPGGPVAARIHPVFPCASNVRPSVPITTAPAVSHITWKDPDATPKLSGYKCFLCKRDLALTSEGPVYQPAVLPPVAILPCGHSFHDQCLQNITPNDQAKDPPCIPCAIEEQ